MTTSSLLLDECGNRIENWCTYFSMHPSAPSGTQPPTVVHSLLIEGQLEAFHQTSLDAFVRIVDHPYEIGTGDLLYLNRDCVYEPATVDALLDFTRARGQGATTVVLLLPTELAGLGLLLDRASTLAFQRGWPIWQRRALSSATGKGNRARSGSSDLLGKAIRSWAVISEQSIRHSFTRAKKERTWRQDKNIKVVSEALVEHHLGFDSNGKITSIGVPDKHIEHVPLNLFKFETTRREARRQLFLRPQSGKLVPSQAGVYRDRPDVITAELKADIARFEELNPDYPFDAYAIASWNVRILLWLRFAYSLAKHIDTERSRSRKSLSGATTAEDRTAIVRKFWVDAFRGIPVTAKHGQRSEKIRLSDADIMGPSEASLIAFFADIDPRSIPGRLYSSETSDYDALFGMARWFGSFYRHRQGYLTPQQALMYGRLLERIVRLESDPEADHDATEMGYAARMIRSFLTPVGLARLGEAAGNAANEGVGRMIYATDPDYGNASAELMSAPKKGRSKLAGLGSSSLVDSIPLPVFVPAGRLLIPGDYNENWVGRWDDLLDVLKDATDITP